MHALKIIAIAIGATLLFLGATVVTIAALWGCSKIGGGRAMMSGMNQ